MPPQQNQDPVNAPPVNGMTSDDLAATLGFLTSISEFHMNQDQQSQDQQQNQQDTQTAPAAPPEAPNQPQDTSMGGDEDKARDDAMEKEIADIRAELEALKQEDTKENDTTGTTNQDTSTPS
jgi:hypothetical protein